MIKYILSIFIFSVILFLYLHINYHLKCSNDLEVYTIEAPSKETLEEICKNPETRSIVEEIMNETKSIGEKLGANFPISIEKRIKGAEAVGDHKTSMLQDFEANKPMEFDAIVNSLALSKRPMGPGQLRKTFPRYEWFLSPSQVCHEL